MESLVLYFLLLLGGGSSHEGNLEQSHSHAVGSAYIIVASINDATSKTVIKRTFLFKDFTNSLSTLTPFSLYKYFQ